MAAKPSSKQSGNLFSRKAAPASINRTPDRESLAADLDAFEQAGGRIEKLGTTFKLKYQSPTGTGNPTPARAARKAKSGTN